MFSTRIASLIALFAAVYVQAAPAALVSREAQTGDGNWEPIIRSQKYWHFFPATTYSPSVGYGACGILNSDSDFVVAVGHNLFDTWP